MMQQKRILQNLWDRDWKALVDWLGDFDIFEIKLDYIWIMIQSGFESKQTDFEMILCFIFAEYHKGLQNLLKSDDNIEDKSYLESLKKI